MLGSVHPIGDGFGYISNETVKSIFVRSLYFSLLFMSEIKIMKDEYKWCKVLDIQEKQTASVTCRYQLIKQSRSAVSRS